MFLAAALDPPQFEPLVGCAGYWSMLAVIGDCYDPSGVLGRNDPPVMDLTPTEALLSFTGFEPVDGATVAEMRAWTETPSEPLAWADQNLNSSRSTP